MAVINILNRHSGPDCRNDASVKVKKPNSHKPLINASALNALTTAALVLPGLFSQPIIAAEGDEVDFQYSHYQEGKRDIAITGADPNDGNLIKGTKSFNPIEVDSLHGHANITLTDRVKFAFNYLQDTWGGATPTATMPFSSSGANYAVRSLNRPNTLVGATPFVLISSTYTDFNFKPLQQNLDQNTGEYKYNKDSKLTHVMSTASPETRKQGDFKLSYDWDNAALSVGGGISIEDDYDSRFGNIGGRFDFNQKQTTLNVDLSYTNSYTHAIRDHDSYVLPTLVPENQYKEGTENEGDLFHGTRQDWATHIGLTQVLNKDAIIGADFSYSRSTGYLSNPYKGVSIVFVDPNPEFQQIFQLPSGVYAGSISTFYEKRPEARTQYSVGGRYMQYVNALDAALHFNYQFSADDWNIQSHTFDADWVQPLGSGWTVTPHVRYYSQDAASFYTPYLVTPQASNVTLFRGSDGQDYRQFFDPDTFEPYYVDNQGRRAPSSVSIDPNGKNQTFDASKLPANYSSDQRLSGFGTLSGGVTIAKQFAKGMTLETGFEYYTHQGGLKIGGGGEASYADFDYWLANAALKVNLDTLSLSHRVDSGHAGHNDHHTHGVHAPAGVMFDHMLPSGSFMVGYRYMWNSQGGNMLNGTEAVNNAGVVGGGCTEPNSYGCFLTPDSMSMSMHMLDLMYAPTDWLTLMLMPQFVDMNMEMRPVLSSTIGTVVGDSHNLNGHYTHHIQNAHETGGIGDLGMYALFKVLDNGTHHLHATAGFSAPTGDVNIQLRRNHAIDGGFIDYGMQLGSGTWDFKPSITYTGHLDEFSWGAQANGTVRMEGKNESGYRLGDMFQGTAWGGYNLTSWLTASVRGVYTVQGSIQGQFTGSEGGQFSQPNGKFQGADGLTSIYKYGPNDYPANYGGRFWDVGFGLSAVVPGDGLLGGNRVSVEWLQPVHTDVNGYQLDRDGTLSATWNVMF
ncbi:MAG: DUF3570 domain-containing protein [Methyloglobulus sp.]